MNKNIYFIFSCILLLGILLVTAWKCIFPDDNQYMVAFTKSQSKANEIQDLLTTTTRPTQRHIIINNRDNSEGFGISVKDLGKKENYKVTLELLNSDILDDSVALYINTGYVTINPKTMLKKIKREYENLLHSIDGMDSVSVYFVLPENFYDENAEIKSINIKFETEKTADNKKIKEQVEKFINSTFGNTGVEIKISDATYSYEAFQIELRAEEEFKKGNYTLALKLLKEANNLYKVYDKTIEDVNRVIELSKKIQRNPNNYRYYIELGDLQNGITPFAILNDYTRALENYEKALKLNPNAKEVYARLGSVYSALYHYNRENLEYRNKSVENHLKAVEFGEAGYDSYSTLGEYYIDNKDYEKALEYYNKISLSDLVCPKWVSNKKVYLNFKIGNFREAYKETENCSVWICKILRLNFGEDECNPAGFIYI